MAEKFKKGDPMSMLKFKFKSAIVAILLSTLLTLVLTACETQWRVHSVADGDTVTLISTQGEKRNVRLYGIDAPERKQAFGKKSKERLAELLEAPFAAEFANKDRYGRFIGSFKIEGHQEHQGDVAEILVAEGLAWWYEKYAPDNARLKQAQEKARLDQRGLWSKPKPLAPWDYRKQQRERRKSD